MKKIGIFIITFLVYLESCFASQEVIDFWGSYDPRNCPLNVEVVKEWETDLGNFQLVRYHLGKLVGTNKTASPVIAAYYGYPKGAKKVPGIVQIHGGGQRASKERVESWVELGFACISINWGGKVLEEPDTPNTDWDGLAAGFIRPGVNKDDELDHHDKIIPGKNTLFKEPHLLNSSWNLIAMSARRALTFLEERPEIDNEKLGVEGHSMGGRATVLTAIDPRVKAASPSVGGSGFLNQDLWGLPGSARHMGPEDGLDFYRKVVSAQSYWPYIKAPILFLGATDDFNSPTELVVKGMSLLPARTQRMLVLAPHLNHRFTTETDAARFLWMIAHLKGDFIFPQQSKSTLRLDTRNHVPVFTVDVDVSSGHPIEKVEIYYGYARDPRIRFWRSAEVRREGLVYSAACPVFDVNEPLFAFANITYKLDRILPERPGRPPSDLMTVSSEYQAVYPDALQAAGIKATEKPQRLIDDFSHGMRDWYLLSQDNPGHWYYGTRKLLDPSFMGPKGGKLALDIRTSAEKNTLAIGIDVNRWEGYTGRKTDSYLAFVKLPAEGLHSIQLSAGDFKNEKGQALQDWDEITELFLTPSNRVKGPQATTHDWQGDPPELRKLCWVEGTLIRRPYPHEPRDKYKDSAKADLPDSHPPSIDGTIRLSTPRFSLAFDAEGRPRSFGPAGGEEQWLQQENPGDGFVLRQVGSDAGIRFTDLSWTSEGLLRVATASIRNQPVQSLLIKVNSGTTYLAFHIVKMEGIPASGIFELVFEMNVKSEGVSAIPLDYMTEDRSRKNQVLVARSALWEQSTHNPLGGFALYRPLDENDEDETILRIWVNEGLPHPKVSGEWTLERARSWISEWITRYADTSYLNIMADRQEELYEAVPIAQRAGIRNGVISSFLTKFFL
ncbi:MAG: hypothetical protein O3C20_24380, partial [Verrucomicrobia bacterium]|nr:hypothetical protein [Verrucomicrobiota bacterium]